MGKVSLGIVQSHATQFDGPLFRSLAESPNLDLVVYYTTPESQKALYDPELKRQSGWDHDITSGYRCNVFPKRLWERVLFARKIITSGHNLVIVAGYKSLSSLMVAIFGRLHGVPVGLRSDSTFLYRNKESWKWKLKDKIIPLLYKLYITGHPTGSLARSYMQHYGFRDEALFFFPYTVDNGYIRSLFDEVVLQRDLLRSKLGIAPSDFVVLGILKFIPREDPLTLLYAYEQVFRTFPYTHLIMVGDGDLRKSVECYIEGKNLKQIHLPGYVLYSHLPNYFAMSDVFVHTAFVESWAVSVNEAMVCGLPVIVADTVGSAADLVENGNTGFVFQAGDTKSLSAILCRLIQNKELCHDLAKNVIERIRSWNNYEVTLHYLINAVKYARTQRGSRERSGKKLHELPR